MAFAVRDFRTFQKVFATHLAGLARPRNATAFPSLTNQLVLIYNRINIT